MSKFTFKKATKHQAKLRLALIGPSGSGKTYSALEISQYLIPPDLLDGRPLKIRVIDSERKSASKYADLFEFEVIELESFEPQNYVDALEAAQEEDGGCDITICDSLSHAWIGKGGAIEQVDIAAKRSNSKNSFDAWRTVTPMHNKLVDALLAHKNHLIVTMRTKTEYVIEQIDKGNGRTSSVPRKIGLQPVQRDGLEYEFDIIGDMNLDNDLVVGKTRCPAVAGQVYNKPGKEFARIVSKWLGSGAPALPAEEKKPEEEAPNPLLERINRPKIKALFDKLDAPEAARLASAEKFKSDAKLEEVLQRRVTEMENTTKPAAPPPAAEEPKQ